MILIAEYSFGHSVDMCFYCIKRKVAELEGGFSVSASRDPELFEKMCPLCILCVPSDNLILRVDWRAQHAQSTPSRWPTHTENGYQDTIQAHFLIIADMFFTEAKI